MDRVPWGGEKGVERASLQDYPYGHKNRRGDVIKKM